MTVDLTNRSILVLAASDGIGLAVATAFAEAGGRVTLFARRAERLAEVAAGLAARTGRAPAWLAGDLRREADVEAAVALAVARHGGLDVLINNSGGPPAGPFAAHDDAAWQDAFELTLLSYVRATRAALPHLRRSDAPRVVNNASSSVRQALDLLILSNAFRMAVMGLTKSLARELGPDGILVNAVGAGRIETDRLRHLDAARAARGGKSPEETRAEAERQIPLGRYGQPEELARLVVFLGSPANTYVTGQTVLADGGLVPAY